MLGLGQAGPRAEDGAAGDPERERDVFVAEPEDHGGGPDGDEHRPADAADDPEEGEFGVAVRQPGHDAGQSLHSKPEHEGLLHADRRGEHAAWNMRKPVADDVERDEVAQRPEPHLELRADEREGGGDVEPVQRERENAQADHAEHGPPNMAWPGAVDGGHTSPLTGSAARLRQIRTG